MTAIKGHLVVVDNPGLTRFFSEQTGDSPELLHFLPQGEIVVLGGIADPGNWDREPDIEIGEAILERCAAVEPRLRGLVIREHRVGLRPTRPNVRVELENIQGTTVIHNCGHGGAGVTLSWGCANAVVELANSG